MKALAEKLAKLFLVLLFLIGIEGIDVHAAVSYPNMLPDADVYKRQYLGCAICIALNGVKQKYSKRTACFLTAMLITAGIAIFTSGERTVFLFVLLLGCVYASNGKTILKLSCILQGGVLFVIILCAITGITENLIVDEERMRYSLCLLYTSVVYNKN